MVRRCGVLGTQLRPLEASDLARPCAPGVWGRCFPEPKRRTNEYLAVAFPAGFKRSLPTTRSTGALEPPVLFVSELSLAPSKEEDARSVDVRKSETERSVRGEEERVAEERAPKKEEIYMPSVRRSKSSLRLQTFSPKLPRSDESSRASYSTFDYDIETYADHDADESIAVTASIPEDEELPLDEGALVLYPLDQPAPAPVPEDDDDDSRIALSSDSRIADSRIDLSSNLRMSASSPRSRETFREGPILPGSESAANLSMEAVATLYLESYCLFEETAYRSVHVTEVAILQLDLCLVESPAHWRNKKMVPTAPTRNVAVPVSSPFHEVFSTVIKAIFGDETVVDLRRDLLLYEHRGKRHKTLAELATASDWRRAVVSALRRGGSHLRLFLNTAALKKISKRPSSRETTTTRTAPSSEQEAAPYRTMTIDDCARRDTKRHLFFQGPPPQKILSLKARRQTMTDELERRLQSPLFAARQQPSLDLARALRLT